MIMTTRRYWSCHTAHAARVRANAVHAHLNVAITMHRGPAPSAYLPVNRTPLRGAFLGRLRAAATATHIGRVAAAAPPPRGGAVSVRDESVATSLSSVKIVNANALPREKMENNLCACDRVSSTQGGCRLARERSMRRGTLAAAAVAPPHPPAPQSCSVTQTHTAEQHKSCLGDGNNTRAAPSQPSLRGDAAAAAARAPPTNNTTCVPAAGWRPPQRPRRRPRARPSMTRARTAAPAP